MVLYHAGGHGCDTTNGRLIQPFCERAYNDRQGSSYPGYSRHAAAVMATDSYGTMKPAKQD